jgi:hypothetical protein
MLGYRPSSLDLVPTCDQAIELLKVDVDVKDRLPFRQEDCLVAGSSFGTYI